MDRHREVRRTSMAAANGLSRRRHRSNSLRDSPEQDGAVELQETTRLRDRGSKKDRERLSRNKRRRNDRLMHGNNNNREDGGDNSSEDSLDDDDEDEEEEAGPVRMRPPNPASSSLNNNNNNNNHHRKSFPPAAKVARTAPWKVSDEMGFSVPKKARSASVKRSHECWVSGGGGGGSGSGELTNRQASTSPARPSVVPSVTPGSPSSSTASIRKKMKPIGQKHRPPKIANKSSSIQDEIEIEVAEVLYGLMRQSQCPPRQEIATNSSRDTNGSGNDAKSRVSSPISASPSSAQPLHSKLPQNSSSSTTPMSAVAPKRKRPRPVKFEEENSTIFPNKNGSISLSNKIIDSEQQSKIEASSSSPKLDKNSGSNEIYSGVSFDFGNSQATTIVSETQFSKPENNTITEAKSLIEESLVQDGVQTKKVVTSPKKVSSSCAKVEFDLENGTATNKATTSASVVENHREENFKFDLMVTPLKSSPERDSEMEDSKTMASDSEMRIEKKELLEKQNVETNCKQVIEEAVLFEKKNEAMVEDCDSQKMVAGKQTGTTLDLQIDLDKYNKDSGPSNVRRQQLQMQQQLQSQQLQMQQQLQAQLHIQSRAIRNEPKIEKTAQATSSLPLQPMTVAGWPGVLPSMGNGMGQVGPVQGIASLDITPGSSNSIQPPQFSLSQSRPKRCATHCYVARNIYCHQQFTKMNPYWPAAAGSASLYGNKPYNLNVLPPTETAMIANPLLASFPGRNLNPLQDKVQVEGAKDKSSVAANFIDSAQRNQMLLPQPAQQAALHGPAFIFPLNHQQVAVAPGNKAGAAKSSNAGNATSSVAAPSAAGTPGNSSSTAQATTMSFNYPNMPGSEAQYVAILQNNGYPFPVPAHVGAPPSYRGTPPQALPFFNGSFYSSQMMHPSQIQQQQQQQLQQSHSQQQPVQQGHQNTSTSSGSSSSQKHHQNQQHNQQQRLQGGGTNAASGNSINFPTSKNHRSQKHQNQSFSVSHQGRHLESDMATEDSPSTEDSRLSQAHKNAYNPNFSLPGHQKNFTSMSSTALTVGGSGSHGERQQPQQQSLKGGAELFPTQAFAMPFASFNGGTAVPGLDFSSMAQNHVIFQNLPEAQRHNYQIAAAAVAAQAAHQKKTHQLQEEGKTVSDSNNADDEKKSTGVKGQSNLPPTIVFSRPDATDQSVSGILGNNVVESSARTLNLISSPNNGSRSSRGNTSTTTGATTTSTMANTANNIHQQQQQQQMHQLLQLQKQQQQQMQVMHQQQQIHQQLTAAAATARGKPSTTSSNSVYTDRLSSSSSMGVKFPNAHSVFPQALIQGGSSTQSPQWKNTRTTTASGSSPSLGSTTSSLKNQQGRNQQGHTQISFGVNSKPGATQHGQQMPTGNQSLSPPVVGSPPQSISKSAGGSPRASSTGSKVGSAPSLSSQQQVKNSSSGPSRKSSPVGGRNAPSNLGNSHVSPAPSSNTKSQSHHHQQQHQTPQQFQQLQQKQAMQQAQQIFFANAYIQAQSPQSTGTTPNSTGTPNIGYYQQRRPPQEQNQQQQPGSSNTASSGMLSLCTPLSLSGTTTSDPTKAVASAAAATNMKGGLPPQGLLQAAQFSTQSGGHPFMSTTFPYIHSVPAVQVKPAEQKQPAGNDNLHACWQPEKR